MNVNMFYGSFKCLWYFDLFKNEWMEDEEETRETRERIK